VIFEHAAKRALGADVVRAVAPGLGTERPVVVTISLPGGAPSGNNAWEGRLVGRCITVVQGRAFGPDLGDVVKGILA
jgi:hypothetical protein